MTDASRRRFELPAINELSKEQEAVNYLEAEGKYLVVGGPGTGKSVAALLRARYLATKTSRYLFLVYNVLLEKACRQLCPELKSARWIGWFKGLHRDMFHRAPATVSSTPGDIDWEAVHASILEEDGRTVSLENTFLVIDEGQDMPVGFYEALDFLDAEHIFVAADQNQQITSVNSNILEIRECLKLSVENQIRLNENFRQKDKGYRIALLADALYPGDPAVTRPRLPPHQSTETPHLYTYEDQRFTEIIRRMVRIVSRNPKELVGVIAPNNHIRMRYFEALKSLAKTQNGPAVSVTTYHSGMDASELHDIRFDRGGIMVINAKACKGLEFDTVFIADVNAFRLARDPDDTKRLFYTMVARARERVFLLRRAGQPCPVDAILPEDETILKRN